MKWHLIILLPYFTLLQSDLIGQISGQMSFAIMVSHQNCGKLLESQRHFDSAVYHYKEAYQITLKNDQGSSSLSKELLIKIANLYLSDGKVDSSKKYIQLSEKLIDNQTNTNELLLQYYYCKGHIYYITAQPDSAKQFLHKSLTICDTITQDSIYVLILKDLGNTEFLNHNYDLALNYYEKALMKEKSSSHCSELIISSLYQNISIIYAKKFEYGSANEYFKLSLEIKERLLPDDDLLLINAYLNYSVFLTQIGDFYKALKYVNAVESTAKLKFQTNHYLLAHIYYNKYFILDCLGQNGMAELYIEKSLKQYKDNYFEYYSGLLKIKYNLALSYYITGDIDNSIVYLKEILENEPDPFYYILSEDLLARCYSENGELQSSDSCYINTINAIQKNSWENTYLSSIILSEYGKFCNILGRKDTAEYFFEKSINIIKSLKFSNNSLCVTPINNKATFHLENGEYDLALEDFQSAINTNSENFNIQSNPRHFENYLNYNIAQTFQGKAKTLYLKYSNKSKNISDLLASLNTFDIAINIMRQLKIQNNEINPLFATTNSSRETIELAITANYELLDYFKQNNNIQNIFEIQEQAKAINLTNSLNLVQAIKYSNISNTFLNQEELLKSQINFYNHKIENIQYNYTKMDSLRLAKYKELRFITFMKYDSLVSYFEQEYPDYFALKYEKQIPKIESIQKKIDSNAMMLNYTLTDSNLFIITITNKDVYISKHQLKNQLQQKCYKYYQLIKKGGDKNKIIELSKELYSILILPVIDKIENKSSIIIIPDDYLYYIPFETLVKSTTQNTGINKFSELNYLIKDFNISYHYSSTLWYKGLNVKYKTDDTINKNSFIGIAPTFGKTDTLVSDLKNMSLTRRNANIIYRNANLNSNKFSNLPYSIKEVEDLSKLFVNAGYKTQSLIGEIATEANFKHSTEKFKYIHIATHGFSNDINPELSGLAFSSQLNQDTIGVENDFQSLSTPILQNESNDGILYAGEMFNLNISADLVVLSACETGIGKLVKGEGMIAMTRGLIYSGAKNIVYTHWKISDKHTHSFMLNFYSEILKGASYAEALRQAKLAMIQNEATAFPKLWSGYMLIGE